MKFPGALYKTEKGEYLGVYNHWADISVKLPPSFQGTHVSHVDYSYGQRTKGIDIFLLKDGLPKNQEQIKVDKEFEARKATDEETSFFRILSTIAPEGIRADKSFDDFHDIHYNHVQGLDDKGLVQAIMADVFTYCNGRQAGNPIGSTTRYVPQIIPQTTIRRVKNIRDKKEYVTTGGKAEFIPECFLVANIDFGGGCIAGWIPGANASFDGITFTNFFLSPWDECRYPCYAADKHSSFPKNILDLNVELLRRELRGDCCLEFGSDKKYGRPLEILRFGKRTEACSKYTLDMFVKTLELMTETETRGIIPTKFLEFNPEIADLLRKTKSSVLFSIGFNELQPGVVAHGCTTEWIFEQAIKYREAKVNSNLYLLIPGHLPVSQRELDIFNRTGYGNLIPMQLLPLVTKSKSAAQRMFGAPWDSLKGGRAQPELLGISEFHHGSYYNDGGKLRCQKIHPDWLKVMQDNPERIKMCHHDPIHTYCGGCGHCKMRISTTQEISRGKRTRYDRKRAERAKPKVIVYEPGTTLIDMDDKKLEGNNKSKRRKK